MSDGFDSVFAALDAMERTIVDAATRGLTDGAALLEDAARASRAYQDQSGATREGTVAYVATNEDDGSATFNRAYGAVEDKNPGHAVSETIDESPDQDTMFVILTVPSDYIDPLETANAGDHAVLEPTMSANAPRVTQAVVSAIAGALR